MTERDSAARTSLRLLAFVWLSCVTNYRILALAQPMPLLDQESILEGIMDEAKDFIQDRLKEVNEKTQQVEEKKQEMIEEERKLDYQQSNLKTALQSIETMHHFQQDYPMEGLESQPELMPVPQPRVVGVLPNKKLSSGKRKGKVNSYMSLCHFKICNMGRKRQSN